MSAIDALVTESDFLTAYAVRDKKAIDAVVPWDPRYKFISALFVPETASSMRDRGASVKSGLAQIQAANVIHTKALVRHFDVTLQKTMEELALFKNGNYSKWYTGGRIESVFLSSVCPGAGKDYVTVTRPYGPLKDKTGVKAFMYLFLNW